MRGSARPRHSRLSRIFSRNNIISFLVGGAAFLVANGLWDSNRGAILGALIGGLASAAAWLALVRFGHARPIDTLLPSANLGTIPATPSNPTPTIGDPTSSAADLYRRTASRVEAAVPGRVILVSGLDAGAGTTTVALNLAAGATQNGRNVMLIDGNLASNRLSRFGRTGASPGLIELLQGSATINEVARLWNIEGTNRFPFIPSGEPNGSRIDRKDVERVLGPLVSYANLVLIDAPIESQLARAFGGLADGAILVTPPTVSRDSAVDVMREAQAIGAPVVGHIVNEAAAAGPVSPHHPVVRSLKRALTTAVVVLIAFTAFNAAQIWRSWAGVERQSFDVDAAHQVLQLPDVVIEDPTVIDDEVRTAVTATPSDTTGYRSFLVVGSDESGALADVIILALLPNGDDEPVMVSLPRDLYLPNRCTGTYTKINAALNGCGDEVNGPTLLALTVSAYTGIEIDNMALFDFDGFEQIIDAVGGIELCLEYPVRDARAELDLPAGCNTATGAEALSWVRSRRTREFVDGSWRTMAGVSDLTRNERQQDVILQMFSKLDRFSSPTDLTATVRSLTDAFTLDDGLGISDAISLAWELRTIDPASVIALEIPVEDRRTESGAAVLVPTVPFNVVLDQVFTTARPADAGS